MKILAYCLKNGDQYEEYWDAYGDETLATERYEALLQQDNLYTASICEVIESTDYTPDPVIAAAYEMREALKGMLEVFGDEFGIGDSEVCDVARAALVKAKEQS